MRAQRDARYANEEGYRIASTHRGLSTGQRRTRRRRAQQQRIHGGSNHGVARYASEVQFGPTDPPADEGDLARSRQKQGRRERRYPQQRDRPRLWTTQQG